MPQQDLAADAAATPPGPGADAIRRALRGPPGRAALCVAPPRDAARRRVAIALLEEAGRARGGAVLEAATGELILTETGPGEAARAAALLGSLLGDTPSCLDLPQGTAALLALPAPVPVAPQMPVASPAGIEALADAAPLPPLLRREGVLHLAPGAPRRLALLRLRLAPSALPAGLGAAAEDADLAHHVRDRLRARLLAALADPARREALLGATPPVPLLLDLPRALLPDPPAAPPEDAAAAPALIAALTPAEALADGLAARAAVLRHAGWGLAVRGLDAAALGVLAPESLPGDLLLLRWSPALAARGPTAALRRVDSARLALTGCDGEAALEWGLALGIARFAGPGIAALMAATRMAACRHAAACSRADCAARAAAAGAEGRAGCADPALLAALLPGRGAA